MRLHNHRIATTPPPRAGPRRYKFVGFRNAAKRSGAAGHVGSRRSYEGQLSVLDARCDVAACVAQPQAAMSDAERQRQSRLLTPHC
eukprot:1532941-Prymnesium_polylepis.1